MSAHTPTLTDGDVLLRQEAHHERTGQGVAFAVECAGTVAGTVHVERLDGRRGELTWELHPSHLDAADAVRALRLAVRFAFDALDLERVETYVSPDDSQALRLASRTGLRREGLLRHRASPGQQPRDRVLLARLVDDAEPQSRDGFIAMLNAGLPTKRVIAQGLLYDGAGRLLLCELTYKAEWDLPGGVVEPGESPAEGLAREIREELGLEVGVRGLRTVNWLPPWRAWDDACVFVFDLGVLAPGQSMVLQPTEIVDVHWCDDDAVQKHAAAATAALVRDLRGSPERPYREAGTLPGQ